MLLSRDAILQASDLETREVEVPEWGGSVRVRALTGKERDAWEASMRQIRGREVVPNPVNARAKLVVKACVDEQGNRLFTDQDTAALGEKSGAVLDRLFDVIAEMSGISDTAVEDAAGNSAAADPAASTSDSPATSDAPSTSSSDGSAPQS